MYNVSDASESHDRKNEPDEDHEAKAALIQRGSNHLDSGSYKAALSDFDQFSQQLL